MDSINEFIDYSKHYRLLQRSSRSISDGALLYDIATSEFELQSHFYVYSTTDAVWKGMNSLILEAINWIELLLSFYKNSLGIR